MTKRDAIRMKGQKPQYPSPAQIRRMVKAAKDAGVEVAVVRVNISGEVIIVDKSILPIKDESDDLSRYV